MGIDNAPKAPAGWYPMPSGKSGEQYWDGESWTGELRGQIEDTPKNLGSSKPKKKLVITISAVALAVIVSIITVIAIQNTKVSIPDLEGKKQEVAISELEALGLKVKVIESASPKGLPKGIVDSSKPGVNSKVNRGTEVQLNVSNGGLSGLWDEPFWESQSEPNSSGNSTNSWAPAGYFAYSEQLAFKWVSDGPDPCTTSCVYSTLDVITSTGCESGLYVEVNFIANGKIVDWSNDSVPSLSVGQTAQLQFISFDSPEGANLQVALMNCR